MFRTLPRLGNNVNSISQILNLILAPIEALTKPVVEKTHSHTKTGSNGEEKSIHDDLEALKGLVPTAPPPKVIRNKIEGVGPIFFTPNQFQSKRNPPKGAGSAAKPPPPPQASKVDIHTVLTV